MTEEYVPRHKAKFAKAMAEPQRKKKPKGKKSGSVNKSNAWRAYVGGK